MMRKHSSKKSSNIPVPGVSKPCNINITPCNKMTSSILKYKQMESVQKTKNPSVKRKRSSAESISRISLASGKVTPSKFALPNQSNCLSVSRPSSVRQSTDTLRSSFGGRSGTNSWPLNEHSFKSNCIDKILEFSITKKFEYPLSRNMLRSPTRKDFTMIFNFIYGQICPGYELSPRFEEEIPKILKTLRYRIQMPKSSFLNVGSPHTWPSVLAMLTWLIDIALFYDVYSHSEDVAFSGDFPDEITLSEKKFLSFVALFHSKEEEQKQMHLLEYKDCVEKAQNLSLKEFEDLQQEEERVALKLDNLESTNEQLHNFQQHYSQLLEDKQKLLKFNTELKYHTSAKDNERALLDSQLNELRERHDQISDEIEKYETMKASQQYSESEVKMFKNHSKDIANKMNHLQSEKQSLTEQIWALEMELAKARKTLSESALKYNALCAHLRMDSCEISATNFEIEVDGWESEIFSFIKSEKKKVKDEVFEIHTSHINSKKKREKMKEALHEKENARQKLECKMKRLEDEIQCLKDEIFEEEKEVKKEYENVIEEVSRARRFPKGNLYEKQRQLEEAKKELESWKVRDKELREKGKKVFMENTSLVRTTLEERNNLLKDHHERMERTITQHLTECKRIIESLELK